jgi:flagellar biosynthesis protein FliP
MLINIRRALAAIISICILHVSLSKITPTHFTFTKGMCRSCKVTLTLTVHVTGISVTSPSQVLASIALFLPIMVMLSFVKIEQLIQILKWEDIQSTFF